MEFPNPLEKFDFDELYEAGLMAAVATEPQKVDEILHQYSKMYLEPRGIPPFDFNTVFDKQSTEKLIKKAMPGNVDFDFMFVYYPITRNRNVYLTRTLGFSQAKVG